VTRSESERVSRSRVRTRRLAPRVLGGACRRRVTRARPWSAELARPLRARFTRGHVDIDPTFRRRFARPGQCSVIPARSAPRPRTCAELLRQLRSKDNIIIIIIIIIGGVEIISSQEIGICPPGIPQPRHGDVVAALIW
jgi:hypothetical protein